MAWLVSRQLPPIITGEKSGLGGEGLQVAPLAGYRAEFAVAMSQSILLPAVVALLGVVCALFLVGFHRPRKPQAQKTESERTAAAG
jgi:hypothetical protein